MPTCRVVLGARSDNLRFFLRVCISGMFDGAVLIVIRLDMDLFAYAYNTILYIVGHKNMPIKGFSARRLLKEFSNNL